MLIKNIEDTAYINNLALYLMSTTLTPYFLYTTPLYYI